MNIKRNSVRLIACFASVMILLLNVSAASFIHVAEAAADQTLTMDKLKYLKEEAITLSYTGAGENGKDWVGIYKTGDVPPGAGASLRWSYLKAGDGTVSIGNGLAPGTYDALFLLNDGYTEVDRKTFEVVEQIPVNGVTLDQQDVVLTEGETKTLTATVTPANAYNTQVSWESSDPTVVSVTYTGGTALLNGLIPGEATVTVTTADGNFTASANVTVKQELSLQSLIASAQAKRDEAVEGDEDGLYAAGSKAQLQSAIDAATEVANDSNAAQEQVDSAKAALKTALQEFDEQIINADVNGDEKRSVGDLGIVAGAHGQLQGQENWNENADVNHDGKVDQVDLEIVARAILQ